MFKRCQCAASKAAFSPMPIWMWACNTSCSHCNLSGQMFQCSCAAMTFLDLYLVLQCHAGYEDVDRQSSCSCQTSSCNASVQIQPAVFILVLIWQVQQNWAWQPLSQPCSITTISVRVLLSSHTELPYGIINIVGTKYDVDDCPPAC